MISLKPAHVSRYAAIGKLLFKYGHADLARTLGLEAFLSDAHSTTADEKGLPEAFARDLEQLGPTFIKFGQLLSTRTDLLPSEYIDALARLQDHVEPLPLEYIERTVEEQLGVRISKAFAEFEPTPLAAASIGQVHRAKLRNGRRVAVKIQRPDLRQQVFDDLAAMLELATVLDNHTEVGRRVRFQQIVESLQEVIVRELDYRQEAENARALHHNLSSFEHFYVPQVVDDYSSERVITLEYVEGAKITDLSPLVLIELDRKTLADQIFRIYLHQVLIDGLFHADPHPGNLMLTTDKRVALMDFGMVARVAPEMQQRLVKLLMALGDGRAEATAMELMAIGRPYHAGHFQEDQFRERVAQLITLNKARPAAELQTGRMMIGLNAIAGETGLKLPSFMLMLAKTLLNLDKVVAVLDPEFEPNTALKRYTSEIFARHSASRMSLSRAYETLLESADFAERLPERLNRITELIASNKLRFTGEIIDQRRLIVGMQKIANRVTAGLILASMIIGASLMMHLQVTPTLFGYPLIAMFFFLTAAIASFVLLWKIAFRDETSEK